MQIKMKQQYSSTAGIVMCVMALVMFSFAFIPAIVMMGQSGGNPGFIPMIVFGSVVSSLILALGIFTLVKSKKQRALMRTGRKVGCEVYRIARIKNGYAMVLRYRGDSGTEYRLQVPVTMSVALNYKEGIYLECYVKGEDAYLDLNNIKEVEAPLAF